jgi:hypothetical protein
MDFIQRFLAPFKFYLCLVFVGPGGVVEAEGFIISRPENKKFREFAETLRISGF